MVVPVVKGDWEPEKLLKEADLALVYKKGDGTSLEQGGAGGNRLG